jgi:phosphoribosylglycinamide formyltransferase-1
MSDGEGRGGRVVLLATACEATNVIYHALAERFGRVTVVIEPAVPRSELVRRRMKRLGPLRVLGQLAFQVGVSPWLARRGAPRVAEILRRAGMRADPIPAERVRAVRSVNSEEARALLASLAPDVVVLSGTRIVGRETLRSVPAPFVNLHAGITPTYRGVHGAYWALADGRPELAGATVHFVDEGIDTGGVIAHARVSPEPADSFATYPTLQLVAGVPVLVEAVSALLAGQRASGVVLPAEHAPLRYHPTIWEYVVARLRGRAR